MKALSHLVIISLFCIGNSFAQQKLSSTIKAVTVFQNNAEITRTTSYTSEKGRQEILLTGISTAIIPSSIQVQIKDANIQVLSAKYERDYLGKKEDSPKVAALKNDLETANDALRALEDQKSSLTGMLNILEKNQDLGGASGSFSPEQVIALSQSYEKKFLEIKSRERALHKNITSSKKQISALQKQLQEEQAQTFKAIGSIVLVTNAKNTSATTIEAKYIVSNAGWRPQYDIRSEGIQSNAVLNYAAKIYQGTNVDWEDVDITVSTGNPSQNNNRPILNPLYTDIQQEQQIRRKAEVMYRANMAMEQKAIRMDDKAEEVIEEDMDYRATVQENQMRVDFKIPNKQSIQSDYKENIVALNEYTLDTEYIYHTVPKLDTGAYLLAKIGNWSQYNLLQGEANIFFEGGFVGTSSLNPQVSSDKLLVSMGKDNSIVVARKNSTDYTATKFIGSNKKETIAYNYTVKNKKNTPITIEILDQIPISKNSDIQVELLEYSGAEYTKKNGKLLWTLSIPAQKSQNKQLQYSVKYPKNKSITGGK